MAASRRTRRLVRATLGPSFNEGARLFWAAIAGLPQTTVRERIGCSVGRLTHWLYGDALPTIPYAVKIEELYGVPIKAWARPPRRPFAPPAAVRNAAASSSS